MVTSDLFSSNINSLLLSNWPTWDNRESVCKDVESIFQRSFRGQWEKNESARRTMGRPGRENSFSSSHLPPPAHYYYFYWNCQRGPQRRRFKGGRFSSLYPLFFFTETAPFLWLRQIFSQLKCTPKMCLKTHWQLVKTLRHWLNMGVIFSR